MNVGPIGFFWIVGLHPRPSLWGWGALVGFGWWWMAAEGADPTSVFSLLLYAQMFAASTGFNVPARLGHFDALLIGPRSRLTVALAHWVVTATPGLFAWTVLGCTELMIPRVDPLLAFRVPSLIALMIASTIPWALTLPLQRWSGGVLWTLLLVGLAATGDGVALVRTTLTASTVETVYETATNGVIVIACPFLLLNTSVKTALTSGLVLAAAGGGAVAALLGGMVFVARQDYPLEHAP